VVFANIIVAFHVQAGYGLERLSARLVLTALILRTVGEILCVTPQGET
jgi:hypothetical protein